MLESGFDFNATSMVTEKGGTEEAPEADKRLALLKQRTKDNLDKLQARLRTRDEVAATIQRVVRGKVYAAVTVGSLLAVLSGYGEAKTPDEGFQTSSQTLYFEKDPLKVLLQPETEVKSVKEEPLMLKAIQTKVEIPKVVSTVRETIIPLDLTEEDIKVIASHEITRGDPDENKISVTFDAGSGSEHWPTIRETLKKNNLKITIFLTADWIEDNPQYVREMVEMGLEIGNHSSTHPDFTKITDEQVRAEIIGFQQSLDRTVGHRVPVRFFRFPYGARDKRTLKLLAEMGLQSVYWSSGGDTGGWQKIGEEAVTRRLTVGTKEGQIFVSHIGSPEDAAVLSDYLEYAKDQGFEIVPISEIIADEDLAPSIKRFEEQEAGNKGYFPLITV